MTVDIYPLQWLQESSEMYPGGSARVEAAGGFIALGFESHHLTHRLKGGPSLPPHQATR